MSANRPETDDPASDPGSGVERYSGEESEAPEGRSLTLRAAGDRGQSLAEQTALLYYRMTWRMPLHRLRLSGKLPLRLLAVPVDPVEGSRVQGMAVRAGHFLFRGLKKKLEGVDFAELKLPPAFEDYIHRFVWLRDLDTAASRDQALPVAEKLMEEWLDANGKKIRQPAWRPDNCGWRLLIWASHAPLILSSSDLIYRSKVLNNIARTARHLDRTADKATSSLGRLVAWSGVVAASLLIPEGRVRRIVGEAGLEKAMGEFFYADGGSVSRSPLNQMDAVILLSMLKQVYLARDEDAPEFLENALAQAVPPLTGLTHFDGSMGNWQGGGATPGDQVEQVIEASGVRARPLRQARDWGYQRVSSGRSVLILDAAPPPIARMAVAGCASTLAFEFSNGDSRIIANCGGAGLVGATIPASLARGLRTTAAHSTLCIDNSNSTSILPDGKLGRGVNEVELFRRDVENATRLEASHDGYAKRFGLVHKRLLLLRSDGLELRGEDMLIPDGRKRRRKKKDIEYALRFHLGPDIESDLISDGKGVLLRLKDGNLWQFRSTGGKIMLEDSVWVDGMGIPHSVMQMVITDQVGSGGGATGWLLKHMG
ncbi:heparinase II/III domain-containing protein [Sphingorhabdus sp. Alg231-15]|uniref:heparinase II/III domain-containing protein n=1 Tax=Sphingorhabdus sp. Alg231-15 TaxID=1922222 RepID=UPI000D557176